MSTFCWMGPKVPFQSVSLRYSGCPSLVLPTFPRYLIKVRSFGFQNIIWLLSVLFAFNTANVMITWLLFPKVPTTSSPFFSVLPCQSSDSFLYLFGQWNCLQSSQGSISFSTSEEFDSQLIWDYLKYSITIVVCFLDTLAIWRCVKI